MDNSNFNLNEELNELKAEETVNEAQNTAEAAEEVASEVAEAVEETASEVAQITEEVTETVAAEEIADEQPKAKKAVHMTASAALLNVEDEEVDIRRRQPKKETKIKKARISYERKKGLYGYGFIAIWLIGVIYMFLIPLGQSLWYSFSETTNVTNMTMAQEYGMSSPGIHAAWNNFDNYCEVLLRDGSFLPKLTESLGNMLKQVPIVMVFSLFIALLLNQKFRGRTLARAIFFLPVLVATGPVLAVIRGDIASGGISSAEQFSSLFQTDLVDELLSFLGIYNLSAELTTTIETITSDIFNLIWAAGIQILIFLAALQQIPTSAKEAASMEGATGWEFFWKITFPMISPMILANLIYTVIDTFIDSENPVMELIMGQIRDAKYGWSSAMAWVYFAIVAAALGLIVVVVSKFVFYENE